MGRRHLPLQVEQGAFGFQLRTSFRSLHALSLEPHAQQIHFGKFSPMESSLVIGDDLAGVIAVFSIEPGKTLS